jgi:ABC-2 type transport system ATP-binding protein
VGGVSGASGLSELTDPQFLPTRDTVFTESTGFGNWTFSQYIRFLERVYKLNIDPAVISELVERFHFTSYQDRKIAALSTGNRKKAYLIAGLALRLPLLILDEPSDSLDFEGTEFLYQAISQYKDFGSIIMSSHIAESFQRCCDLIYVLKGGDLSGPYPVGDAEDIRRLASLGG